MSGGVSIDVGSALLYLEDKVRRLLGRDAESREALELLHRHVSLAGADASHIQLIGMDRPVPIQEIYQPASLTRRQIHSGRDVGMRASYAAVEKVSIQSLLEQLENVVVVGRAGQGKTVFLHNLFATLAVSEIYTPLLFTLRRAGAAKDLVNFVRLLTHGRLPVDSERVLLLVDGFDEIATVERRDVASALREFRSLRVKRRGEEVPLGHYFVTCREFYDVSDVPAMHLELAAFTREEAAHFVAAFAQTYGSTLDAEAVLSELSRYGLEDFAAHPLTLAMVCILKSGARRSLPRTPLELIQAVIEVLTRKWDESKGVERESSVSLSGQNRVRCMAAVAYSAREFSIPYELVKQATERFLSANNHPDVDADSLLTEISQWFGILIPITFAEWTFAHRTFHDYLAARWWVSSGFQLGQVTTWDARAAMAMSLVPDATEALAVALIAAKDLHPITDALRNGAKFVVDGVAPAIIERFKRFPSLYNFRRFPGRITAYTRHDFFDLAPYDLLCASARAAAYDRSDAADLVMAYSAAEMRRRGERYRGERYPSDIASLLLQAYATEPNFDITRGTEVIRLHLREVT